MVKKASISKRVFVLSSVITLVFLILFSFIINLKNREKKLIFEASREQFNNEIQAVLKFYSEALNQVTFDYTYWDEFVSNIENFNPDWFLSNIASIRQTYQYDYVAVYDSSFHEIFLDHSERLSHGIPITVDQLAKLKRERFLHFYIKNGNALLEVSAASVHKSDDSFHKKTNPFGYLFIARVWDKNVIGNLARLISADVKLKGPSDTAMQSKSNEIIIKKDILGWDSKPLAQLQISRKYKIIALYDEMSRTALVAIIISTLIAIIIYGYVISKWVNKPLRLIEHTLKNEDEKSIKMLQSAPGEFGDVGNMLWNYVLQKKELQVAKEKAVMTDRLKSEFLCNMSHEIRTPMNGIMGFSELLNNQQLTAEERKEYTRIILNSSYQLLRIIDDILEISKLETRQVKVQHAETNISSLLSTTCQLFKSQAETKGLTLKLKNSLNSIQSQVLTDSSKLQKILNNLLENAIKFTEEGYIEIGCAQSGNEVLFSVQDTGIGIAKDKVNKIFDRFTQADENIAITYGGLGLGLAIVFENIELLGGKIRVESTPGIGSAFHFSLPYIPCKVNPNSGSEISVPGESRNKISILIAEDEETNSILLKRAISGLSSAYKVIQVSNGQDAVSRCAEDPSIEMVLMDYKMPVMNGIEATQIIKSFRPDLPIIMQTAYSTTIEKNQALAAGCDEFITKPIKMEILKALINKFGRQSA
jgi:signal transduction histidine kinase/CheY-like chemotaxis protein